MSGKVCRKCRIEKPATMEYFHKESKGRGGLSARCKECKNEIMRNGYHENIEKARERCRASAKKWTENHLEESRERARLWARNNYDKMDKKKRKATLKKWIKAHPEKVAEFGSRWRKKNPDKIKIYIENAYRNKRATAKGRLDCSMSASIYRALAGKKKGRQWEMIVGYGLNVLMRHLEKQFPEGMTWENYGKWHVDHKIPKAVFNYHSTQDIDFKRCWSLKNLQPMWAKENLIKNAKIEKPFQPCLAISIDERANYVQM